MPKISLNDNLVEAITKMSDGNPGAMNAMIKLQEDAPKIDPQNPFGPFGPILSLDSYEIYGTDIYILFNDKCGSDSRKMMLLLRGTQLGKLSEAKLKEMAADQMYKVNLTEEEWEELDTQVCEQLEEFQKAG